MAGARRPRNDGVLMSLHVINKTDPALWHTCLGALSDGDALLLIEDAVFAALPGYIDVLKPAASVQVLALSDDLALRGISARITPSVRHASWQDFVVLSLQHDKVVSWH